jgi:alpha-mannosidase II
LFDYINGRTDWNTTIRFSNLSDYFAAVERDHRMHKFELPVYHGDFFTYVDRDLDYWSGYFSTRAYMKSLTRRTTAALSAAENLFSLCSIHASSSSSTLTSSFASTFEQYLNTIESSRQSIALFQHHDGITGTARRDVVRDYGQMLHQSLLNMNNLMAHLIGWLLVQRASSSNGNEQLKGELLFFLYLYPFLFLSHILFQLQILNH